MKQQTTATKKYAIGTPEWVESQREMLARITGIPNYVDILKATCRALQGPKSKQEGK